MFELSVKDNIAAAHFLREYEGKCKNLHGHTWQVEVVIQSDTLDKAGMVMDFIEAKSKLKGFLEHLDHVCLNDLEYFKKYNPTTENIAKYVYQNFQKEIGDLSVKEVRVWESPKSSVTYYEP